MSLTRTLLAVAATLLLGATTAAQGAMDGQWFKLKVVAKGRVVDARTGAVMPTTYKSTVYMFLEADGGLYDYQIRYESAPGVWGATGFSSITLTGANEEILASQLIGIPGFDDVGLTNSLTLEFKIKKDAQGVFNSATVKTLGGVLDNATLDGESDFEGGIKVTGKTIAPDKVPQV